jgi:hypothetical protein
LKSQNGVLVYDKGEEPEAFRNFSLETLRLPFGIKLIESESGLRWVPGTREDFLAAESKRLGQPVTDTSSACDMAVPPACRAGCIDGTCSDLAQGSYHYCVCLS